MDSEENSRPYFHKWLDRHKVVFEVCSWVLLGLASIAVSLLQYFALEQQNKLVKTQSDLARFQAMPQFVISYHQILSEKTDKYDTDEILIENRGGFISDFSVEEIDFLKVEFVDNSSIPNSYTNLNLPLNGYFDSEGVIARSGTGNLTRLQGFDNNARFIKFQQELRQFSDTNGCILNLDAEHFARLNYKDITGLHHTDYFKIRPIYGGDLLSANEGDDLFKQYYSGLTKKHGPLQFDLLVKTPQLIFSRIQRRLIQ